jgi:hypothetical protein
MGIISDQFRAQIAEMQVRHEEADRRTQESLGRCFEILAKMKSTTDAMLEELEDA